MKIAEPSETHRSQASCSSASLIDRQRTLLREAVTKVLGYGQNYALVDFPNFSNVGDSAIWLGARALLEDVVGRPRPTLRRSRDLTPPHLPPPQVQVRS